MKKMYMICFLLLGAICTAAYLVSYQIVYESTDSPEQIQEIDSLASTPAAQTQAAIVNNEDIITKDTLYVVETYDLRRDTVSTDNSSAPLEVLGYNRNLMNDYLKTYMDQMSKEEEEAGLISFELKEFNTDRVIVRKTYSYPEKEYQYFLDIQLGRIVVCNVSDRSLYAYTEIKFQSLPEEIQQEILAGKYLESVMELYEFLEAYSS